MYFNIHCGSCAPAERDLPSLATVFHKLSEQPSVDSREISEGVVVDYDANGNLVGIDIDNASKKVQLEQLILNKLPSQVKTVAV
ncbi:MAG: DUF2283 domain-containing protein [Gammaproteobacteria bacterium]